MKRFILSLAALGLAQMHLLAQLPAITNAPVSRVVWAGTTVTFSVGVSGEAPFAYEWTSDAVGGNGFVAGNGSFGYSGDGGPASTASFGRHVTVAADAVGNVFIADIDNQRIRKVDVSGTVSTVAGNGESGYSGDGGPATNAALALKDENPGSRIAVDGVGNLFIADSANNCIRKVDTKGVISTVAAVDGPTDVAVDGFGRLFVVAGGPGVVQEIETNGTITGVADGLRVVSDMAGNLFIIQGFPGNLDEGNHIVEIQTNGVEQSVAFPLTLGDPYHNFVTGAFFLLAIQPNGYPFYWSHYYDSIWGANYYGTPWDPFVSVAPNMSTPIDFAIGPSGIGFLYGAFRQGVVYQYDAFSPGATLIVYNVSQDDSGDYQVTVGDTNGNSTTSSTVSLTVVTSPQIYNAARNPHGSMVLSCVSPPGSTNLLQAATNLAPPVLWQTISTNIAGSDGDWQFTDTNTANAPARFYRSATLPGS